VRLQRVTTAGWKEVQRAGDGPAIGTVPEGGLLGSWSATRWHYTSRDTPGRAIDVVCDLRGTVTLSLSAGTYVLTWDVPGRGGQSIGGAWLVRDDDVEFSPAGSASLESVAFHLGTDELSLRTDDSAWDFSGDGVEEPAGFVAVFVRL
jgi:hypothetical protein